MKIEVPAKLRDCELWQLYQFAILPHSNASNEKAAEYMAEVLSIFCEIPQEDIMNLRPSEVKPAYLHVMKMMGRLKWDQAPPQSVQVKGVNYTLRIIEEREWTFGQLVDMTNTDFKRQPERLAAILFVEEGKTYAEMSMADRAAIFIDHFPRDVFAQCVAFFLAWCKISIAKDPKMLRKMQMATKANKKALRKVDQLMNGQR